ncbi:glycosyltransferase [Paenibacillus taichungensis]|uniref:glycosyltransferase n=1 Tax=Paenibacillus taichungensis TaxID=484184 RepID=UPI0035D867C7
MMCTTFMDTATFASTKGSGKTMYVGPVIREELKLGSRARGIHFCRFVSDRPILLIMGGSQGSEKLNRMVLETLPELLKRYQIIHICGTGKLNSSFPSFACYKAFEYVHEELADLMVMADMVVSRAGSNAIHEWLLLRKPMLLIPHANGGSRVGQTLNAKYFQERGYARVLQEEELTAQTFLRDINLVYMERDHMVGHMKASGTDNAVDKVLQLIHTTVSSVEKS